MKVSDYRLIKIKYDQTLKEFEANLSKLTGAEMDFLKKLTIENINTSVHRRNNIVDWIWLTQKELHRVEKILSRHEIRHRITDHTKTYYHQPEKLTTLRKEIDEWMQKFLDMDLILDRIGEVGLENITKIEKKYLQQNFNKV